MSTFIQGRYTRQDLWSLFLMCAFPLHAWTLILAFRDISWLTERTNAWDAVGVLCYGLLFALVESALLFLLAAALGLIVPRRWEPSRRVALLSAFVLILSAWAMLSQLFFLAKVRWSDGMIQFLAASGHPAWIIYGVVVVLVTASFALPAWAFMRSPGAVKAMAAVIDRLGVLTMLYLVFDAAALVIIVIRNL